MVVLGCIVMGTRAGGVGVGLWGGLGTFVLVFVFGEAPGEPPAAALAIILRWSPPAAMMQAAGGIDWMVAMAARVIEKRPKQITLIAPLTAFLFSHRRRDQQHHLPAAAGDLRRLLQERDPAVAAADRDGRAVRHGAGRLAGLGGDGGDADPDRRRALQPRPHPDPGHHHPGMRGRHRRHRTGGQPDVEGARRRPRGPGQDRLGRAGHSPPRRAVAAGSAARRVGARTDRPGVEHRSVDQTPLTYTTQGRNSALVFLLGVVAIVILGLFPDLRPSFDVEGEARSPST